MNERKVRSRPTVVVIIPYYNGSKFIERSVRSVFEQSTAADEVIVVNDGSHADEQAFLYDLAKRYPFRIIDKENGGQGSARNAGVQASTSEFICFLDQDDFYLENHIEVLTGGIPSGDRRFGFVYADLYEADGDGNVLQTDMVKAHSVHPKRAITDLLRNDMFVLPSASLINRKAFEAIGGFDPQFMGYEDDDMFMRIFRKGYSNYFIDKPVTVWCIHIESTSYGIRMIRSRFKYFKKLAALFPDEVEKARYYFRDCLVPRFGRAFVVDAIKAVKKNSEHRAEVGSILMEYAAMVRANPAVGRRYKLKLTLAAFVLAGCPVPIARVVGKTARLPFVRRLVA
jgi:glycosyltransferase involved in cell wall biosynthesis